MDADYDVVVVGAGPGGYVAAIRCAQLGLKTACVDDRRTAAGKAALGGTCLNVGCIPSKALLDSSDQFYRAGHQLAAHGIEVDGLRFDLERMQQRKQRIVAGLSAGIGQLFKANSVTAIGGRGQLMAERRVAVFDPDAAPTQTPTQTISARHVILAPGAVPIELPAVPFDAGVVVDSTGALAFDRVPERLGIIGAGVIGLELGSVWSRLGAGVVLLEAAPEFLPTVDHQVAREAARQFKKQGLDIRLGALVQNRQLRSEGVLIEYVQQEQAASIEVDRVIVAVGRRAATAGLLAADCGVSTDAHGLIEVDQSCRTAQNNVWAVGDAVRGPMLAHKSAEEGMAVAESIAGDAGRVDFNTVPWVIYTSPEIAWVGQTEKQLEQQQVPFKTGVFPFAATGRAQAMEEPHGLVKLIAHADTDRLLGVHMIGPHVSELIGETVLGMEFAASAEDFARTVHAHPTLSEAIHEAALAVDKRAIHKAG